MPVLIDNFKYSGKQSGPSEVPVSTAFVKEVSDYETDNFGCDWHFKGYDDPHFLSDLTLCLLVPSANSLDLDLI